MYIRAGLIYQIINGLVTKEICKELIYWSDYLSNNEFYYDMYYVGIILKSYFCYEAPIDFDPYVYFGKMSVLIPKIFPKFTIREIYDALSFYVYEYSLEVSEEKSKIIPGNPVTRWFGAVGKDMENMTKFVLQEIYGFSIGIIDKQSYKIPGTDIVIVGKADGIVDRSPGGIYDGYVLECKYVQTRCSIDRVKTQIACYSKIYNRPVLLTIMMNNEIKMFSYSCKNLDKFWDGYIYPKLDQECREIKSKIFMENIKDIPEYIEFMTN